MLRTPRERATKVNFYGAAGASSFSRIYLWRARFNSHRVYSRCRTLLIARARARAPHPATPLTRTIISGETARMRERIVRFRLSLCLSTRRGVVHVPAYRHLVIRHDDDGQLVDSVTAGIRPTETKAQSRCCNYLRYPEPFVRKHANMYNKKGGGKKERERKRKRERGSIHFGPFRTDGRSNGSEQLNPFYSAEFKNQNFKHETSFPFPTALFFKRGREKGREDRAEREREGSRHNFCTFSTHVPSVLLVSGCELFSCHVTVRCLPHHRGRALGDSML